MVPTEVPPNFWTLNGVQVGSALEMLLLSLALGSRYAGLRNENIRIVQSSHVPMLDEAATRIVKLSQPFAPLPKTQEDPDVLHVTRTWQFLPGGELVDR